MAEAINRMVDSLRELIRGASSTSEQVAATSEELAAVARETTATTKEVAKAIEDLTQGNNRQSERSNSSVIAMSQLTQAIDQIASGAQEQARDIVHTSQMINEMAQSIEQVAGNAQNILDAAGQTANAAEKGKTAVGQAVEGMRTIQETVFAAASKIKDLGQRSQQIGEIIQVIDDIAEQTNLLALNAAIEAARAGEHGKGFAVVADEVRKLAERSGKATKEIADLITSIQNGTVEAVASMETGTSEVQKGVRLADNAGEALSEILATIQTTNLQVQSIAAATRQMTANSVEVVKAVDNVSAITEESTAATQQMAASSSQVDDSVKAIAELAQSNAAAAEEVFASTEQMHATAGQTAASAQVLEKMSLDLQKMLGRFRLEQE
ncbi:methyl-accepting chemotaxis protein, partial [bacterium]